MTKSCPTCRASVRDKFKFCPGCGASLEPSSPPAEPSKAACPACGQPSEPGQKFCGYCGESIDDASRDKAQGDKPLNGPTDVKPRVPAVPAASTESPDATPPVAAPPVSAATTAPAGTDHPGPCLCQVLAGERRKIFPLDKDVLTIGKDPHCDLALPGDSYMSHVHARLVAREGNYLIEDLDSRNSTFVEVRAPLPLQDGDRLLIGTSVFEFCRTRPTDPTPAGSSASPPVACR